MPRGGSRPGAGRKSKPETETPKSKAKPDATTRKAKAKRARGRPQGRVASTASQVEAMAGYGLPHKDIAKFLGITEALFSKLYETDIAKGLFKSNARLAQTAYQRAYGAPAEYDEQGRLVRAERQGSDVVLIFLLKVRLRWRTTDRDDPPPEPNIGGAPVGTLSPDAPRMIIEGQSIEETARVYREIMAARR